MDDWRLTLIVGIVLLVIVGLFMFGARWFSNAVTPVEVIEPVNGVQCVKIVTADGAAVDCWYKR